MATLCSFSMAGAKMEVIFGLWRRFLRNTGKST